MDSPIPPDPYNALGLSKNATGDEIRKAYRKLALQLHPDKCKEESLKAQRTDEFHLVQQAYDIIGDEEKRSRYDAQIRLAELKRANLDLRSQTSRATAGYDVRTAAPRDASYATRGPTRPAYEDPHRERAYEYDAAPRPTTSRKASGYDEYAPPRREPVSREREAERFRVKMQEQEAEARRKKEKRREAEVRESRSSKYDSREIYEEPRKSEPRSTRPALRKEDVYDKESTSPTHRKMEDREQAALRHMQEREQRASVRPAAYSRTTSSREIPPDYQVRRSAAPAKERARESTQRSFPSADDHRRSAEESYDRAMPAFKSHSSAPPIVEASRQAPHRSYTTQSNFDEARASREEPPPPAFSRATTMPPPPRRKDSSAPSSKLRHGETIAPDSGYSSPAGTPAYTTSKSYAYPLHEEKLSTSPPRAFKTVIAEPKSSSRRTRSPSPVRPSGSNTAAKMASLDPKRYVPSTPSTRKVYPYGDSATPVRPSMPSTTASTRDVPIVDRSNRRSERERGRGSDRDRETRYSSDEKPREKLYGEQGAGTPRGYTQPTSFATEAINYSKRYDMDDVSFGGRSSKDKLRGDEEFVKPRMMRTQTYAY
jgi:curved DNA-binding protein CbpA